MLNNSFFGILIVFAALNTTILSAQGNKPIQIEAWLTNPDRSALFEKQADSIFFSNNKLIVTDFFCDAYRVPLS